MIKKYIRAAQEKCTIGGRSLNCFHLLLNCSNILSTEFMRNSVAAPFYGQILVTLVFQTNLLIQSLGENVHSKLFLCSSTDIKEPICAYMPVILNAKRVLIAIKMIV